LRKLQVQTGEERKGKIQGGKSEARRKQAIAIQG
jgi:hypothetical protein